MHPCTHGISTSMYVIQRGNNREPCFFSNDDYVRYLEDLHDAAIKNNAVIHAYVLMTNHAHLFII